MTPNQSILNILNPVHSPTVKEWERIADYASIPIGGIDKRHLQAINAIALMELYEEITRGKIVESGGYGERMAASLTKTFQPALLEEKHFRCKGEKPFNYGTKYEGLTHTDAAIKYAADLEAYESALKEVVFEWVGIGKMPSFTEIESESNRMDEFIKIADRTGNWNWTMNLVEKLLK